MVDLSVQNKKAVSEIVSYTLLIIIAIGASIMVYELLNALIPKPNPTCPDSINLIISDYSCSISDNRLNVTLINKGRFSIDSAYLRVGEANKSTKTWINNDLNSSFNFGGSSQGLAPNHQNTWSFVISNDPLKRVISGPGKYALEVQPAMYDKDTKRTAACESLVSMIIDCS